MQDILEDLAIELSRDDLPIFPLVLEDSNLILSDDIDILNEALAQNSVLPRLYQEVSMSTYIIILQSLSSCLCLHVN